MAEPNYFTSTLGQAASLKLTDKSFTSISAFVDAQAKAFPSRPAVAFANPAPQNSDDSWSSTIWTFSQVRDLSSAVAAELRARHGASLSGSRAVALICPSTPEFLFVWLALMRLGLSVLLIAPQCQPSAIAHLCRSCDVHVLYHDEMYETQAAKTKEMMSKENLETLSLPFDNSSLASLAKQDSHEEVPIPHCKPDDVAYFHHTSGTSSGVPKPIPQTHNGGCGVLPHFPEGHEAATFTTTPLYHGGIADLFRAWASGALIWLFPGTGIPITASNVVKCLDVAAAAVEEKSCPPVRYFSSVPYVLQAVEADPRGLQWLQRMDIVGVGGAALPADAGDKLVNEGVNLISRFGSAECGFLLSSHRDFEKDKEWQYLRSNGDSLRFEDRDGLSELVVPSNWPHMAKRNREDGSFATSDLFAAHDKINGAWRYHSRADSQLTLITGKKFDPAPLEDTMATSDLLDAVVIFGDGQPYPGALLFRSSSASGLPDAQLVDKIWPAVQKLNADSQDHARLQRHMLRPMTILSTPLEKSSKGTLIRGAANERFAREIEAGYEDGEVDNVQSVPDEDLVPALTEKIQSIVDRSENLGKDTDLFSYGVDSVAAIRLRSYLRGLVPRTDTQLPLSIVEDCGTVERLAKFVIGRRRGQVEDDDKHNDEIQLMLQLVDKYSQFDQRKAVPMTNGDGDHGRDDRDVVLLTGATGALGAHLLDEYRKTESVRKIYCLVRGSDDHASRERISKALEQRQLQGLPTDDDKVVVLTARLGDARLGLSDQDFNKLTSEVSIIMHVAWSVNFRTRLRSFEKDNIASVLNLINLALQSSRPRCPRLGYCSSVASVLSCGESVVPETFMDDPTVATGLGYSRSKWVAEQICRRARDLDSLRGRICIFRVGQLSGDSERGVWNTKEAWPMMLSTVKLTKALPDLEQEVVDWLAVDVAAKALMQAMGPAEGRGDAELTDVVHVLNSHDRPSWRQLLQWLREKEDFEILEPGRWVERLEKVEEVNTRSPHPALKLLGHWRKAYVHEAWSGDAVGKKQFATEKSERAAPVLGHVKPVDEQYFRKIWSWIDANM